MLLIGGLPLVHRVMYTCFYFLPRILLVRMFGRRGGCLLLRLLFLECFKRRTEGRKREDRSTRLRHKRRSQLKCGRCTECCNQGEDLRIVVGRLSRESFEEELLGIRGAL